jgi:hypothetical protein
LNLHATAAEQKNQSLILSFVENTKNEVLCQEKRPQVIKDSFKPSGRVDNKISQLKLHRANGSRLPAVSEESPSISIDLTIKFHLA